MPKEIVVRQYRDRSESAIRKSYERDARRMARDGYEPIQQQVIPGRRGCAGYLTFGIANLFIKPKSTLIVTYKLRSP